MLLLHVAAVLAVVATLLLGRWQLGAWQLHREDQAAAIADRPPVPLDEVLGPDDPYPNDAVGQPVEVSGAWVPDSTTYVAGRPAGPRGAADGYWQLTSLAVCPKGDCTGASAIPVVLGWTPQLRSGTAAPSGPVALTGWLQPGEGSPQPDDDPSDDVLSAVRIPDLLQRSDRDLYAGFVILRDPASARGGLTAVTPDSLPDPPASAGLRNLLYAVQWWVFGGFAVFLWWRWCRDEMGPRLPSEE
jgi:cytochrome oxidase assembly protein ShyY1